ncbi:TonB-dependent receptor [Portibacter marinus]|uniref:TonB-dependent receptor n=1 Tax=Portibacter marinus TaxID=2898660 RepID=UPI001F373ED2|nr:TonB-dependent receptor [Portibacter marinus]
MIKYIIVVGFLLPINLFSQVLLGEVVNGKNEPLIGASVYWQGQKTGVTTDIDGHFEIEKNKDNQQLITSYVGFLADTTRITDQSFISIRLKENLAIEGVVVKGQRDGIIVSNINPIKTEQITQTELKKAACCDLAGCFGTQASVQPHTTNVITNSKELRILGLSGVYNQVLINGLPMIQGLSYTYGISSFPGTAVDNIFISKGANSVLQGFESISGQINVETKNGDDADKLLLNLYLNSFLEKHANANFSYRKGYWSNLSKVHVVEPAGRVDRDGDTFLDLPLLTRYTLSNISKYRDPAEWGWNSIIGIRYVNEKRVGGQLAFEEDQHRGGTQYYGQVVQYTQPEIWTKTGFRFDDYHNLAFNASAFYHDQNSTFGTVNYLAKQTNFYANAQYERNYRTHQLKTGASIRYLNLDENIELTRNILDRTYAGKYSKLEVIPGLFAENTMQFLDDRLTWIAGARIDHHNQFGWNFTPRTLLKFDLSSQTVVRANVGTGWRTANIFSENINQLASSRDIIFEENLDPEEALNYGMNLIQKFDFRNISGYLSTDFYRTEFQNQIFPDFDTDPTKAFIRNFYGTSVANGFQAEANVRVYEKYEFKVGYNYLDVFRMQGEEKMMLPFNSKHRFLTVFSYRPTSNKFFFDVNAHWFGKQRLPNTGSNPETHRRPDFSKPYSLVNAQFTYNFKKLEVYSGCENLFDFRQERPIISWQDPFSLYFDTNSVWGPTRGREFYIGVRYYMREK